MKKSQLSQQLFSDYFQNWVETYKEGAIRLVTMKKYRSTQRWLEQLAPKLRLYDLSRLTYQKLLNDYAEYHERQTTMDFHHQLKGAILQAFGTILKAFLLCSL